MSTKKTPPPDPLIGAMVSERYRIASIVGRGGMGVVYRGEDERLHGRPCAIKVLLSSFTTEPENLQRFDREVRIISMLRSPHLVHVFDTGRLEDGRPYIVMELLEGRTLSELQKKREHLSVARALRITDGVLAALAEAHENGIIHRDLKPTNVFLVKSRTGAEIPKVLDFGIAKDLSDLARVEITHHDTAVGTPKYMSPEQFRGCSATARTDLYALGLLLYQMLAGRPPFMPDDPVPEHVAEMPRDVRLGYMHMHQEPVRLPVISPQLWALIARLLCKNPEQRFATAEEVIGALRLIPEAGGVLSDTHPTQSNEAVLVPTDGSSSSGFPVLGEAGMGPRQTSGAWQKAIPVAAVGMVLGMLAVVLIWANRDRTSTPTQVVVTRPASAPAPQCLDTIRTVPQGAMVRRGERELGKTPLFLRRPCVEKWLLEVSLDGYEGYSLTVEGRSADEIPAIKLVVIADAFVVDSQPQDAGVSKPKVVKKPQKHKKPGSEERTPSEPDPGPPKPAAPSEPVDPASPLPF